MDETVKKRQYHSPQRQEQAEATRRKIIEAARRLFATHGYGTTTLSAIAQAAGVSMPTVTAVFGTKAAILNALIKLVVRGDTGETLLTGRQWWQQMLAEPDSKRQLQMHVSNIRRIHERSADVAEIVRGAATADPEIAAMLVERGALRLADTRKVVESLAGKHALARNLTLDQAIDLLWALETAELYRLLVVVRGWSPQSYEEWLTSVLIYSLLDRQDPPA